MRYALSDGELKEKENFEGGGFFPNPIAELSHCKYMTCPLSMPISRLQLQDSTEHAQYNIHM